MKLNPRQLALWGSEAREAVEREVRPPLAGKKKRGKAVSDLEERFAQDLQFHGVTGWVRQGLWCPGRKFAGDFVFGAAALLVEVEGGLFGRPCKICKRSGSPSHSSVGGILRDIEKSQEAALAGFTLVRLSEKDVRSGKGIEIVKTLLSIDALPRSKP